MVKTSYMHHLIKPEKLAQLRQEQTAWPRERTTRCKQAQRAAEAAPEWPRLYHACLTAETEARRKGLMRWLSLDHPSAKP